MSSGEWPPPPPPPQSGHRPQHPYQYHTQRSRYDVHPPQQQQSLPMVHDYGGSVDIHAWWMVAMQQQQQQGLHPSNLMAYRRQIHHGFPALPVLPVGHWQSWTGGPPRQANPVVDPRMYDQRRDDEVHRRRGWQFQAAPREVQRAPVYPRSPSPLRLPSSRTQTTSRLQENEAWTSHASSSRPTPCGQRLIDHGYRAGSPRRRNWTPRSCPEARADPPESSGRCDRHNSVCWTVGRSRRRRIDESGPLTNSMQKRRRVSRTEYLRLPVFSEDERGDVAGTRQQQRPASKTRSFIELLLEDRRKSAASFSTPERSEARRDEKMENSSSATPPPTRRLSVIKEGTEVSAGHSSRSTPPALRRQVSPPQTDARSWYDGERTPSSPSLPRINPADYGCGVPEDDGGFTTDVERGLAGEEDIGSSSSDDEASNESGSDEDSSSESSTSAYEIVQRGDEIVRRKRRKKREPARDLEFIDWSEEFNTGIIATAHEPTLRFKKVVTRRFGAKLRGHPMFREDVQRQEQENGDKTHVAELQM